MAFKHTSVLLEETISSLNIRPEGIYVDGTMGGAGHGSEIAKRLIGGGRYIGIDQDEAAIQAASERLAPWEDRVTLVRSNYERFEEILEELGISRVDGVLLDLGVSSYQLATTSMSIIEISEKCGYLDSKYFLRQFSSIAGMTPVQYRTLLQG